jgi:hypothetical protein
MQRDHDQQLQPQSKLIEEVVPAIVPNSDASFKECKEDAEKNGEISQVESENHSKEINGANENQSIKAVIQTQTNRKEINDGNHENDAEMENGKAIEPSPAINPISEQSFSSSEKLEEKAEEMQRM